MDLNDMFDGGLDESPYCAVKSTLALFHSQNN